MQVPLDEDELAILDDETIRVFSYYDRDGGQRKRPAEPIDFHRGDELVLPHIHPETAFRYRGTVARNCSLGEDIPHFRFDCPMSDFPVTDVILNPNEFMQEMGDQIWYY